MLLAGNCERGSDFITHGIVVFVGKSSLQSGLRFGSSLLTEGPSSSAPDEWLTVIQSPDQGWNCDCIPLVTQDDGRIAQNAAALCPPERRMTEAFLEPGVVEGKESDQIDGVFIRPRLKGDFARQRRAMIPGADILAHIAAEEPIAETCSQFVRNGFPQFDRQITDALRRIEHVRLGKRLRRTGIETSPAAAAMVGRKRLIGG